MIECEADIDSRQIKVSVVDGVVTLSGEVSTWSTSFDIEDTARYTSGVVGFKNNLLVE